jgi:predicted nucleic acid-binding protein
MLLDTCVLSEIRKPDGNRKVRRGVEDIADEDLYLSVITVVEISKGIELLEDGRHKRTLQSWLRTLERDDADRLLSVDRDVAHIWGELTAMAQKRGRVVSASDGLIAATARHHGLHVMTRNIDDSEPRGAMLINPWEDE